MLDKLFIEADEIDYKAVFKDPLRWFGFVYPYFIILLVAGGLFWVFNMGSSYENQVEITLHESHAADSLNSALVEETTAKMIATSVHPKDAVSNLKNEIINDNSEGAQLLKQNIHCYDKALYLLGNSDKWQQNPEQFVKLISSSLPNNGFRTSVMTESNTNIEVMFNYLKGKYPADHLAGM